MHERQPPNYGPQFSSPNPADGLLRGDVSLPQPVASVVRRPKSWWKSHGWKRTLCSPWLLTLVCAGVLVCFGLWLTPGTRENQPQSARVPPATRPLQVAAVPDANHSTWGHDAPSSERVSSSATSPRQGPSAPEMAAEAVAKTVEAAETTASSPAGVDETSIPQASEASAESSADVLADRIEAGSGEDHSLPSAPAPVPLTVTTSNQPQIAIYPLDGQQFKSLQQAWARHLKQPVVATNDIEMKLSLLPPGQFTMGSPASEAGRDDNEGPERVVRITRPFYLGQHEVTVGQFGRFVKITGYVTEGIAQQQRRDRDMRGGSFRGKGRPGFGRDASRDTNSPSTDSWLHPQNAPALNFPVVRVTWQDAVEFCNWLSETEGRRYRLPTEAEWEYACRGGTAEPVGWAPKEHGRYAWFRENSGGRTRAVGTVRANAFGLFDMHGNVAEWCGDWFRTYGSADETDPRGPADGDERVLRGGAWDASRLGQRAASRAGARPAAHSDRVGFRVACEVDLPDEDRLP